jgi:hypothetical protein
VSGLFEPSAPYPDEMPCADRVFFGGEMERYRCLEYENFTAYFLPPHQFSLVAPAIGRLRATSYREISPHGPGEVDLDGRDNHYWHVVVWDQEQHQLAGSLRLALSHWHGDGWSGRDSYLEHCYPGLDAFLKSRDMSYAEIGRTFVADSHRRTTPVLFLLLRAMASLPMATGHQHLLGMVSYNQYPYTDALNQAFFSALQQSPCRGDLPIPAARHPLPIDASAYLGPNFGADSSKTNGLHSPYLVLERTLRHHWGENFNLPVLLRKYSSFGNAHVLGLSLAKDFNQIVEILMHCDLGSLSSKQRRFFLVEDLKPVWLDDVESPSL